MAIGWFVNIGETARAKCFTKPAMCWLQWTRLASSRLQTAALCWFDVWEGMWADIILTSSRPVPNMSAKQWSLPTAEPASVLILRLCLRRSLFVAYIRYFRNLSVYSCFSFISNSFSLAFCYFSWPVFQQLFVCSDPREVYLFNSQATNSLILPVCCSPDHRTLMLNWPHIWVHVMRLRLRGHTYQNGLNRDQSGCVTHQSMTKIWCESLFPKQQRNWYDLYDFLWSAEHVYFFIFQSCSFFSQALKTITM